MNLPKIATANQRLMFKYGMRNRYSLLCADPRLGKTPTAIWLQQAREVNCLVICPSYLIPNWKKEILKWAPNAMVTSFSKGSQIYEPCDSDFVITSYDLVQKAEHLFEWCDMVVMDECLHEDTLVQTKSGLKRISDIRVGDEVKNFGGYGIVEGVSQTSPEIFYEVSTRSSVWKCTGNHPFLTSRGWKAAKDLHKGALICVNDERLQIVRERIHQGYQPEPSQILYKMLQELLLEENRGSPMQGVRHGIRGEVLSEPGPYLGDMFKGLQGGNLKGDWENSFQDMAGRHRGKKKIGGNFKIKETSSTSSRWKWSRSSSRDGDNGRSVGSWILSSIRSLWPKRIQTSESPESLQNRLCGPSLYVSSGNRWGEPQRQGQEITGREEIEGIGFSRVESVKIQKQGSILGKAESYFYDLKVSGHPSFTLADGTLVHNCHNLKSMAAKRTQFIHKAIFENSVQYVYGLTGTPLKNRVREFYSLLAMMYYDPRGEGNPAAKPFLDRYPDEIAFAEKFSFRSEYQVKVQTKRGATFQMPVVKYEGLKNVAELKFWLEGRYIRLRAGKGDLPPISYRDILISESPDQALLDSFNAYFEGEGNDSVRPDVKVQAALKKVPFTIKYVENLVEIVDCCLIYSDHRESIEAIAKHFKVPAITGKMPGKARAQLVADFQAGKSNILCATIGALKEGADLFRSKDIVISDLPWVPGDLTQVINRVRAIGQKDPRTVHQIFGSPQDEKIAEVLRNKIKVIEAAT